VLVTHLKPEVELFAFVNNTAESQAQNPSASTFCERAKFTDYDNKLNLLNKIPKTFRTLTIFHASSLALGYPIHI
jgi:hypothetical protein